MNVDIILKIIFLVIIPFIFVTFFIPCIKRAAKHINALDIPDKRKVHKKPIPRIGGLGIYAGFLLGYLIFGEPDVTMNSILIGSFVIIVFGLIDDINPMPAKIKFLGQLIASLIVVFYGNILLSDLSAFGIYIDFGIFKYPITILFILGCINSINLIDGLDGLAGGIGAIYFLTIGIISTFMGQYGLAFLLSFILFGSTMGFLMHNYHNASIFMGDTGSMFLGYIIAIITLLGYKNVMMSALIIPLCILTVPILDTLFAIIRRKLKGESITKPDKYHIHHQFLKRHFTKQETVIVIHIVTLLFSIAAILYVLVNNMLGYIIYGILSLLLLIFVIKTDVIFDHHKK